MSDEAHLWDADHPYYASEGNYFSNDCHQAFATWPEFVSSEGDADMDMNLIYRWDWKLPTDDDGEDRPLNSDPYYRDMTLKLFYIGQRKALARSVEVSVCQADEPSVRAWLEPRLVHLLKLWSPLLGITPSTPPPAPNQTVTP